MSCKKFILIGLSASDDGQSCRCSLVISVVHESRMLYNVLMDDNKMLNICVFLICFINFRNASRDIYDDFAVASCI